MDNLVEVKNLKKKYGLKEPANWCAWKDLNPQPPDPKSGALSN